MPWINIVLFVIIIVQEIQILALHRDILNLSDLLGVMLTDKAKKIISIITDEEREDDE